MPAQKMPVQCVCFLCKNIIICMVIIIIMIKWNVFNLTRQLAIVAHYSLVIARAHLIPRAPRLAPLHFCAHFAHFVALLAPILFIALIAHILSIGVAKGALARPACAKPPLPHRDRPASGTADVAHCARFPARRPTAPSGTVWPGCRAWLN